MTASNYKTMKEAPTMSEPRLVPILDAAKIIGVKPGTLRVWGYAGQIKTVKLGRKVMIPSEEIDNVIQNGIRP